MRNAKAFTAIEVAVAVVLVGVLTAIAIPSLKPLLQRQQLGQATQQVEQFLRRAQQTAINRDRTVYVVYTAQAQDGTIPARQYMVVGDPCRPDDITNRLKDDAGNDRIDGISTEDLPSQVDFDLTSTTVSYPNCPTPAPGNTTDMAGGTTNPNTVVFDFQGQVRSNSGTFVRLRLAGTTDIPGTKDTFVLTQLGDVGTISNTGAPVYSSETPVTPAYPATPVTPTPVTPTYPPAKPVTPSYPYPPGYSPY